MILLRLRYILACDDGDETMPHENVNHLDCPGESILSSATEACHTTSNTNSVIDHTYME